MPNEENRQYCSIDLEFTGFDPDKDQILEIGFAFFSISERGVEIGEQWSQVFKPSIEVHEKIFGLTGITPEELETAPEISEFVQFLSDKLHDKVLVAHNPILDVKFLESAGVKLSGEVIDSLELVQILLPTHHSYNLENLTHYFKIEHETSHRALADSLSVIHLIDNLLKIFAGLSPETKQEMLGIMDRGDFSWQSLFEIPYASAITESIDTLHTTSESASDLILDRKIILDSDHYNHHFNVARSVVKYSTDKTWLIAVPDNKQVMDLWQAKLGRAVFGEHERFNKNKFEKFLEVAETNEELRFCLKVVVWLATNWQTESVVDLNLSFFGGQFKSFVVGGKASYKDQILICNYSNLLEFNFNDSGRELVIVNFHQFEKFLTSGSKTKISWNGISYALKLIYNPETNYGDAHKADLVVSALAAVDLFFGLVQIILRQNLKTVYLSYQDLESKDPYYFDKINNAAKNLSEKLAEVIEGHPHSILGNKLDQFNRFFSEEEMVVKWFSLSEENVGLHSQPLVIETESRSLLDKYADFYLTESLITKDILFYSADRLGLSTELSDLHPKLESLADIYQQTSLETDETIFETLVNGKGAQIVVFDSPASVKDFYKKYYEQLKQDFTVLAQEYSGSGNKIFRNFSMFNDVILLATADFISKQQYAISANALYVVGLPEFDDHHPYHTQFAEKFPEKFIAYKANYKPNKVLQVIRKVAGKDLPQIVIQKDLLS